MATIKNGILGGFNGKIGTAVGYQIGDESYIRALPIRRAKPTKNELINRAKFKLVQDTLNPLKDFLKVGFKNYGTKTGGYRSAVSYTRKIALVADDAGIYIDPALLKVSGGDFRRDGTLTIEIPHDFKGREIHAYIGFVSDDREIQSDSQYLGKIEIPA